MTPSHISFIFIGLVVGVASWLIVMGLGALITWKYDQIRNPLKALTGWINRFCHGQLTEEEEMRLSFEITNWILMLEFIIGLVSLV